MYFPVASSGEWI